MPRERIVRVSFILATFNRRNVLVSTLGEINRCGLDPDEFEIHVVDNASTDGTAAALADAMETTLSSGSAIVVHLSKQNLGACAKNIALPHAQASTSFSSTMTRSHNSARSIG